MGPLSVLFLRCAFHIPPNPPWVPHPPSPIPPPIFIPLPSPSLFPFSLTRLSPSSSLHLHCTAAKNSSSLSSSLSLYPQRPNPRWINPWNPNPDRPAIYRHPLSPSELPSFINQTTSYSVPKHQFGVQALSSAAPPQSRRPSLLFLGALPTARQRRGSRSKSRASGARKAYLLSGPLCSSARRSSDTAGVKGPDRLGARTSWAIQDRWNGQTKGSRTLAAARATHVASSQITAPNSASLNLVLTFPVGH